MHKAKAETYERFQRTVQHSLGEEVSWNHLAFLFYTTKGVISAVGKGSKLASDAKEMTLRYFSEKFANWILDQGGFVSIPGSPPLPANLYPPPPPLPSLCEIHTCMKCFICSSVG